MRLVEVTSVAAKTESGVLQFTCPVAGSAFCVNDVLIRGTLPEPTAGYQLGVQAPGGDVRRLQIEPVPAADSSGQRHPFKTAISLSSIGEPSSLVVVSLRDRPRTPRFELSFRYVDRTLSPRRAPLVITSPGRSGSTYLMGLLSGHPDITVPQFFPFETRIGSYFAGEFLERNRAGVYGDLADNGVQKRPLNQGLLSALTASELFDFAVRSQHRNGEHAVQSIDHYYSIFGNKGEAAEFYAEKMIGYFTTQEILAALYGNLFREIILVRDFRDAFASAVSFNNKRGTPAFGREAAGSDLEWIKKFSRNVADLARASKSRRGSMIVRYENLVTRPHAVLGEVFRELGIEADDEVVRSCINGLEETDEFRQHKTSSNAAQSIGRWRSDLPTELIPAAETEFADTLRYFGYSSN